MWHACPHKPVQQVNNAAIYTSVLHMYTQACEVHLYHEAGHSSYTHESEVQHRGGYSTTAVPVNQGVVQLCAHSSGVV